MTKNVFIIGLDDFQRQKLATIHNADRYAFHGLLGFDTVVKPQDFSFQDLLNQARRELQNFPGSVDAIIAHWDFPTSVLGPILCREYGIPSPSLESVLKCEHKYWSRVEQQRVIPECVPRFFLFDPFDNQAVNKIELEFPFWIKPVKSFASQLGFKINNEGEFRQAQAEICEGITKIGSAFDEVLHMVDLPSDIRAATGISCIAEEIISGIQAAPEGAVFQGEYKVHGVIDMPKDRHGKSFSRYQYPSTFPEKYNSE
ncbi:hypothetical protein [Alkalilimnicola ehrlichii]|uniref:hypothetical protein n=1 Tax=Alkalilimnicola ehrlichii TaxID=351052 RepID=UPI001C6ECC4B|nr:hypothetical protein [Alkalilimnicola ehrlichii]